MSQVGISTTTPTKDVPVLRCKAKRTRAFISPAVCKHRKVGNQVLSNRSNSPESTNTFPIIYPDIDVLIQKTSNSFLKETYSQNEVHHIVENSLFDYENILRDQYTKILDKTLLEQRLKLSKFNEDYIKRKINRSEFDYLS